MVFKRITLSQYRNFDLLSVEPSPNVNVFIGMNGQGKTNLLEAIQVLINGDSFRYGNNQILIRNKYNEARLLANFDEGELNFEIKTQILKSNKNYVLNDKKIKSSEISYRFPVVVFSPESLSIIKESDEKRRSLIDGFLSQEKSNQILISNYRKTLKTRNQILKQYLQGQYTENETKDLIESINTHFLKDASELTSARINAINEISSELNSAMSYITKQSDLVASILYEISGHDFTKKTKQDVYEALQNRLVELRAAEMSAGSSLVGPHKHDIKFLYNQKDSRFYCSQGQQRALILSFKIAQIVYHRRVHKIEPVLLLDDVLSELDLEKRSALISFLNKSKSQIFITTTDLSLTNEIKTQQLAVFKIVDGKIIERSLV